MSFYYFPGVDYAVCISAQLTCEESNRLGIKLGEIIEIVRKKFGDKTHLAVKDGKPGLVGTANVQLSTYEKVYGGMNYVTNVKGN